jgi:hypothetical protein
MQKTAQSALGGNQMLQPMQNQMQQPGIGQNNLSSLFNGLTPVTPAQQQATNALLSQPGMSSGYMWGTNSPQTQFQNAFNQVNQPMQNMNSLGSMLRGTTYPTTGLGSLLSQQTPPSMTGGG